MYQKFLAKDSHLFLKSQDRVHLPYFIDSHQDYSSPRSYRAQQLVFGSCSFYKAYCFSTFIAELKYHDHK